MRSLRAAIVVLCACGHDPAGRLPDAPVTPDAPRDGAACIAGGACAGNQSSCRAGVTTCTPEGAELCSDGAPVDDGTACGGGLCAAGDCLAATTIADDTDLSTMPVTPGRTCAEAPQFAVASLTAQAATLAIAPAADCLAAGDEVMLISLQGAPAATVNVGNWELLFVAAVAGDQVTFTSAKQRFYGSAADSDAGLGDQKVALVRVPRFGDLTIEADADISPHAWDGATGGVLAIRAARFSISGSLTVARHGYRPGRWSQDTACTLNIVTEAGESVSGPALQQATRNTGAAGGIAAFSGPSFNDNTPISPSAGHATAGQPGVATAGRTLGEIGAAYGLGDGTKLTMGSGSSGNLTCDPNGNPAGALVGNGTRGAGIVALFGGDVTVNADGAIVATPVNAGRDVASSGGYIYIKGGTVALADTRATARGSTATGGSATTAGMSNAGSRGYIRVDATGTVTGTTDPPLP